MQSLTLPDNPLPAQSTANASAAMAGLSEHTQRAYRRWIQRFLDDSARAGRLDFDALPAAVIQDGLHTANLKAWLGMLKAQGLGKQSLTQARAAVIWLAQLAADLGWCEYDRPAALAKVSTPRAETGQRAGTWLTTDEVRLLLSGLQSAPLMPVVRARNYAILCLMAACGLRREEVAAARWQDVSRQRGHTVLNVHGKGEKLRIAKLPTMVVAALDAWKDCYPEPAGDEPMFTRIWKTGHVTKDGITDRAIWLVVQQAAQAVGLPRVSPHDLRRSFARGAYEAGVPYELIRQALGHTTIATTERYVNSALELDRSATDIWAEALE